ncbi:MAG: GC-type dockerin domain-anchored protein [Planctomycetota bacterium]|nr:GC-type dockerin domain-anchored protein [Planctomycetota bacterium]
MLRRLIALSLLVLAAPFASAQWNPAAGQWGRTDSRDVRVMTWNVLDNICRTQPKVEGSNGWCALARIVAAMKPDVLILEECGDNSGNGTGAGVDSVAQLTSVLQMFSSGGTDTFLGGSVTAYVQKYDPSLSYPYIYVSDQTDNFNRNCIISRYPFTDLNGDGLSAVGNIVNASDLYAPGGGGGIRGFGWAEIDLPNALYRGNLVMGFGHLKSGGTTTDLSDRLKAGQNIAYIIDYLFNGGGTGTPNPRGRIISGATAVLDAYTPVIWGGDFNEDENTNGRDGPALWMTRAQVAGGTDGTDRDRSDSSFDDARDPFTNSRVTQGSSSKLDYICWQDSIATLRRSFIFNSASIGSNTPPAELAGFGAVAVLTSLASDHRPVIADFILPAPPPPAPGAFALSLPADGESGTTTTPTLTWGTSSNTTNYTVKIATNAALTSPILSQTITGTSFNVPSGLLGDCTTYYWGVVANGTGGNTNSTPASRSFSTRSPADFNGDGFLDFTDFDAFVSGFEAGDSAADYNADGFIDFTDFDAYVAAFESGC